MIFLCALFAFMPSSEAQERYWLKDHFYQSRSYIEPHGVKLDKKIDREMAMKPIENYLEVKLKPYLSYELVLFDRTFVAALTEDTTVNIYSPERFIYIQCNASVSINGFITYGMSFLLDSNYQLLWAPEQLEARHAQKLGQIKRFKEFEKMAVRYQNAFIEPIAEYKLYYDRDFYKYCYRIESQPSEKKYNERVVLGDHWKRYERMNKYLVINAITGEVVDSGYELQKYDTNGPSVGSE